MEDLPFIKTLEKYDHGIFGNLFIFLKLENDMTRVDVNSSFVIYARAELYYHFGCSMISKTEYNITTVLYISVL